MVAARYRIEENRLQYKYFYQNKKFIWLNIPFINEINPMLNFIHFSNHHLKKDRMAAHVIKKGFFGLVILKLLINLYKIVVNDMQFLI